MRIVFAGGGTGGHFYPIVAIAEKVREIASAERAPVSLYYMAPHAYNPSMLQKLQMRFVRVPAGKIRSYRSLLNILDPFKTFFGIFVALVKLFSIYPDVVFGKGGYASFPVLLVARALGIPVIIHESDTIPGKVNRWAGAFARNIAISWPEAIAFFPKERTALTGQPIRDAVKEPLIEGSFRHFGLSDTLPVIAFIGGSQGAARINDFVLDSLPKITETYQVIHQTGENNFKDIASRVNIISQKSPAVSLRYKGLPTLSDEDLRRLAGIVKVIVSRGGSFIFEIALWGIPSIIIPIPETISHDQRSNAYAYARTGSASVIEEENLTQTIFLSELARITEEKTRHNMSEAAKHFGTRDAAYTIANALLRIGKSHEQ